VSRALALLLPGVVFGTGLAISGMTNPAKVTGFLDVTGRWDPSLALVMAGAMAAFGIGGRLVQRRPACVQGGPFPPKPSRTIDGRLVGGSLLFGVGWGLAGFCPGPAVTNLATLRPEVFGFVGAMVLGMLVAQRAFGADR
jgi:uncharacterized membrane protein YedE/YeeE